MEFIWQVFSLLSLVFGIFAGEYLATRAFGRPKMRLLAFAEILVFVTILVVLTSSIYAREFDLAMLLGVDFVTGAMTALIARGISTGVSVLATMPGIGAFRAYSREERLLIRSAEALAGRGFEPEEIKEIFRRAGFSGSMVEAIFRTHRFEHRVHPLIKEVARLEEEAAALRASVTHEGPAAKFAAKMAGPAARTAKPAAKEEKLGGIAGSIYELLRKNRRKEFTGEQLRERLRIGSTKESGKVMVSNAVSELEGKGLISVRREGKFKFYSVK